MRAVLVIFVAILLGYCGGQPVEDVFEMNKECAPQSFCVATSLCNNGTINVYADYVIRPRLSYEKCVLPDVCCLSKKEKQSQALIAANVPKCGTRNIAGSGVRTPNSAMFGEFPWLLLLKGTEDEFYGGASLIHPQVALTAAHIVENKEANELSVYAGVWSTNFALNKYPHQKRSVTSKVLHEKYKKKGLRNDIALLILSSPFQLQSHINTICLPPPNFDIPLFTCYGTGWGQDIGTHTFANIPKKIDLSTQTYDMCQSYLRDIMSPFFNLHESFMCAGGDDKDMCFGDGGSPLVCPREGKLDTYYQIGIVSWGIDCGKVNVPGVYVNLAHLREWVDIKFIEFNFDPTSYTK